ncbi:MAG: DUF1565 domain-containing protein [Planctomycetota bacterium]
MRSAVLAILLSSAGCLLSHPVLASDYFVDAVSGNDATGDGTAQKPWRTITHSFSQIPGPDDTLWVLPGTYDVALGEVFPLTPMPKVSLVSIGGKEVTHIVGDGIHDILVLPGAIQTNPARPQVDGFTISGGHDAIVLAEAHADSVIVTILNSTISGNSRSAAFAGSGIWVNGIRVRDSILSQNRYGILIDGSTSLQSYWDTKNSRIEFNSSHGILVVDGSGSGKCYGDVIRNNGGAGIWQSTKQQVRSTLTNTTISGNAGGGVYIHADIQPGYYYPYYPVSNINVLSCVVYGNGGFGGVRGGGTSPYVFGQLTNSIAFGNSGLDNANFKAVYSDVGTGNNTGLGVISADPQFIDAASGDFRLHAASPCVDTGNTSASPREDFEGQPRPQDGNSDGTARADMGIDEFTASVFPSGPAQTEQPFSFSAEAPPAQDGELVVVLLAGNTGAESGGIPLPGSGGLRVDLDNDALFQLGLRLHPVLQATLVSSTAQTPAVTLPRTAPLIELVYSGFTFDVLSGVYTTVFPPHSFQIQPGP